MTVQKPGFKKADINFTIDVGKQVTLGTITLDIAQITETVAVTDAQLGHAA